MVGNAGIQHPMGGGLEAKREGTDDAEIAAEKE
jgi:hypothetical protein